MTSIQFFLLFIVVLTFFVIILLRGVGELSEDSEAVARQKIVFAGKQGESRKRDCDVEIIYSMEDEQCDFVCKAPGLYRSHNGVCVNILAFDSENVENKCDPRRGVLAYLLGDPQFGRTQMRCLSVDPGIQPDDPEGKNIICGSDASIDINYLDSFPQLNNCKCVDENERLALISNTSEVRKHADCVTEAALKAYNVSGLVYDPSDV